jgi:NADH dehydrogenase
VGRWLGAETDRAGRVVVTPFLHLKDDDRVFVLGDGAHVMQDGAPLPGLAPIATQEGRYVAKRIHALIQGLEPPPRFRYVDKGSLATIGRASAVGVIAGHALHGMFAWLLWAVVHVMYLIGFRNRLFVVLDWTWAYFTYQRGARVLVGDVAALTASEPAPPARPAISASVQKVPSREQPTATRSDAWPHHQ